jgi:hypothetical protein
VGEIALENFPKVLFREIKEGPFIWADPLNLILRKFTLSSCGRFGE